MKIFSSYTKLMAGLSVALIGSLGLASAILVQPYNYMLDDSALVEGSSGEQPQDSGSLSPFYNDQSEQSADKDIVGIIGEQLRQLRFARMLQSSGEQLDSQADGGSGNSGHLSQEMAELLEGERQQELAAAKQATEQQAGQSLSASVANMLLGVAADGARAAAEEAARGSSSEDQRPRSEAPISARGSIVELDTSGQAGGASSASQPSKSDLKPSGPSQWFNPKETIPVLKISSMATPSKYKKVYFRSEKKLVDGAFHSLPSSEQQEKKSFIKSPFNSGVQRRSSGRGHASSSAAAPPSPLQDGVIDFLKKFRDVYIQTRPVGAAGGSSAANLASSFVSAAASSPLASVLAPSGSSRPSNFASALSAATSMVAQAAASSGASAPAQSNAAAAASGLAAAAGGSAAASGSSPNKSPLSAQSYVSFWSKTFPTWVRKMLKQLRRRSLYSHSKRQQQQQHHQHSASSAIGQAAQAAASGAVASVMDSATSGSGSSGSHSSGSH